MEMRPFWTCVFLIACATALFVQPVLRYVLVGWRAKRKDILDGLGPGARLAYFVMFGCSEPVPAGHQQIHRRTTFKRGHYYHHADCLLRSRTRHDAFQPYL